MTGTPEQRSSSRRARNSITVDAVLDAAERVAARDAEALTIRAVATELESSPMALYRYFATKDELVDALLDRVLGRFEPAPGTADWRGDLRTFATTHLRLLLDHPWAVARLIASPFPGPSALPIGEAALGILRRAGITGDRAVAAFSGIVALNYGWASFALARSTAGGQQAIRRSGAPASIAAAYPLTAGVAESMSRYGSRDHYRTVLDALVDGIGAPPDQPDAARMPVPTLRG